MDCLFCKMVNRDIEPDIVYEDDHVLAFNDINPQAPTHILIIPKKHIATLNDIEEGDLALVGRLQHTAARVARDLGFAEDGYRVVMNCNDHGGQSVYHVHMHLMGGRRFTWPAG
ncbi:histidine triad nucleotide-binding protein [Chromohalobacter canadensis]|uniref:Histidine triad nucleotide-binding protein n=1 Tax=Chromohalobacter canadensis TaxID=141389 RepID=A0ABZ0Y813_9GAMM|nr:histidine triad nucleotide-binding protein [Chromohalobacter canadensis]MCK0768419.1 histidine triad nucleotide-binding protein [Chromohalobacter canadensis]WQH08203.1 histidine triad nucleotide-binding protein [Chromohalobacter canadensis]